LHELTARSEDGDLHGIIQRSRENWIIYKLDKAHSLGIAMNAPTHKKSPPSRIHFGGSFLLQVPRPRRLSMQLSPPL